MRLLSSVIVSLCVGGSAVAQVPPAPAPPFYHDSPHHRAHHGHFQHHHHSSQKASQKGPGFPESGSPESGAPPAQPQGGYAAPPRSGTMAGATQGFGLEGLQIELPSIRLKAPSIRFPSLTRYFTPPRMKLDEATAPFVTNVQREFSGVPAPESGSPPGSPESGAPESGAPESAPPSAGQKDALQKVSHCQCPDCAPRHHHRPVQMLSPTESDRVARLEAQIAQLTRSMELLVAHQQEMTRRTAPPAAPPQPRPYIQQAAPPRYPVQPSSYVEQVEPSANPLQRLPSPAARWRD